MIPSKKKNTKASQLRERLRQLREDHERELAEECTRSDESFPVLSFVDQIFDFEMLHKEELSQIGVDNLFCSEEEDGKKFVTAIVREAVDIEILTSKLRELGLGDDCQITAERFYFASHFETPCCMQSQSAQAGYGTGNFLLTSLGLMGVTAAHVVLPMMEKETVRECRERVSQDGTNFFIHAYPLSHRDPLTHRYPLAHQSLQVLGHTAVADVHESLDIAIFLSGQQIGLRDLFQTIGGAPRLAQEDSTQRGHQTGLWNKCDKRDHLVEQSTVLCCQISRSFVVLHSR
jgi:hypothetical protein